MKSPAREPPTLNIQERVTAPLVASLVAVDREGTVRVNVPGHGEAVARVLASVPRRELQSATAGREVMVLCEGGDPARPVILGLLEDPAEAILALAAGEEHTLTAEGTADHRVFRAAGSITLVCGEASLTLHADGRVVTRGVNVVSVASEQQRIQGAVVRIN